jgi:hypothetical protein
LLLDRGADHRALPRKLPMTGKCVGQAGSAMLTLIESTVTVTITHSDSEASASVAATTSFSRDEATGAERALKPTTPGDRIMADFL